MATYSKGILGGFIGKVGNVVGSRIFGIDVMRSYQPNVRNPKTEGQLTQRGKFRLIVSFISLMLPLFKEGFKHAANKMSAFNKAVSVNIADAITGTLPNFLIDYPNVKFSQGSLDGFYEQDAMFDTTPLTVSFAWTNNPGPNADANDKFVGIVYNPTKDKYESSNTILRQDEVCDITVPADWAGEVVQAWGYYIGADGSAVSDSLYFGTGTIAST
ncbi:DUF6266 family protein [Bacteroidota bacterium]